MRCINDGQVVLFVSCLVRRTEKKETRHGHVPSIELAFTSWAQSSSNASGMDVQTIPSGIRRYTCAEDNFTIHECRVTLTLSTWNQTSFFLNEPHRLTGNYTYLWKPMPDQIFVYLCQSNRTCFLFYLDPCRLSRVDHMLHANVSWIYACFVPVEV